MIYKFPKNFLFGVGTSSYQIEGGNVNTDWWYAENHKPKKQKYPLEKSGIANDFWNRYQEDIDLAYELGVDIFRMSVEWSRIEPREGYFDEEAIFHYKKIMEYARSKKLKIFLTLHHFTIPLWFELKGGFLNYKAPRYFSNYALRCVLEFKSYVECFTTINEPEVLISSGYLYGDWPPFKKNLFHTIWALNNIHRSHNHAYTDIKNKFNVKVGIVTNIICFQTTNPNFINNTIVNLLQNFLIYFSLKKVSKNLDYIGLNFYQTFMISGLNIVNNLKPHDEMGWYINFDSIRIVLNKLKKFKLPIYITENGLADEQDLQREWYIKYMLASVSESIYKDRVDVRGYIYWSLIDNYEWQYGYQKKFGLVEVLRNKNLKRIKRKSFEYYKIVCKTKQVIE